MVEHQQDKSPSDAQMPLRWAVYGILIALAGGITAGRLLAVQLVYEPALHRPADRPDLPAGERDLRQLLGKAEGADHRGQPAQRREGRRPPRSIKS